MASNRIRIIGVPYCLSDEIKAALTLRNPAFQEAQQHGRWTGNIPRNLCAYEEDDNALVMPRGFGRRFLAMARCHSVKPEIVDSTRTLCPVEFKFQGKLRPFQEEAVADILGRPIGALATPVFDYEDTHVAPPRASARGEGTECI